MPNRFTDQQLQAYLDEALPTADMSAIEKALRVDAQLRERLLVLAGQREAGVHGLGEIWRRHRLSCPPRTELGCFLLGTLDGEQTAYIRFHVEQIGCRLCAANLQDLEMRHAEKSEVAENRRRRYFQTSAGLLRDKPQP